MILTTLIAMLPQADHIVDKVDLSPTAAEGSYFVASMLMKASSWILNLIGLQHDSKLFLWIYSILVFCVAFIIGYVLQKGLVFVLRKIDKHVKNDIYTGLTHSNFFSRISKILPAIVFLILIQFTLYSRASLASWLTRLTWIYITYILARSASTLTDVIWAHIDTKRNTRHLPLRGLMQVVKGVVWIVAIIISVAILLDKSPGTLLAGLGAFAAVLMLVFKDSILGVVAGVQLSENDSLHVGDWIKVKGTDANGTVTEVGLTAVKVLNWDKTTTTLPPYNLVTNGFTNYRTMQTSNTRQIQRSYYIDADSVVEADEAMLDSYGRIPLLADWIAKKREQKKAGKVEDANNSAGLVDGSIETNLGVFRAYMKLYLDAHPGISHDNVNSTCFVTTLAQTNGGIPLQLYCFTSTSAWTAYEAIQASIIEHMSIMMAKFGLITFENTSGRDTIIEGWMGQNKDPNLLFGFPSPFLKPSSTSSPADEETAS